jgi:hypothetical protein
VSGVLSNLPFTCKASCVLAAHSLVLPVSAM